MQHGAVLHAAEPRSRLVRTAELYMVVMEVLAIVGMIALTAIAGTQVFCRYVLGASLVWSDEFLRYMMVWTACLLAGPAYTRGQMLGARLLVDSLPDAMRRIVDGISRLLILVFLLFVAWQGWSFAMRTQAHLAPTLQVSMFWIHLAIPTGCLLLALHVVADFLVDRRPAAVSAEAV